MCVCVIGVEEAGEEEFKEHVFTEQISHHYTCLLLSGQEETDGQVEKEGGEGRANHLDVCLLRKALTH